MTESECMGLFVTLLQKPRFIPRTPAATKKDDVRNEKAGNYERKQNESRTKRTENKHDEFLYVAGDSLLKQN